MPKPVYDEIDNPKLEWMKKRVDNMIKSDDLIVVDLLSGTDEFELYYKLGENPDDGHIIIGNGEASSIALAKVKSGILASNNLRDILPYVEEYSLEYITTADILLEAYIRGIIDEKTGNTIWDSMLKKRRRLGAKSFSDYLHVKQSNK